MNYFIQLYIDPVHGIDAMIMFNIKSYKKVICIYGYDWDVIQQQYDIASDNKLNALADAKRQFCEHDRIRDWSIHADRFEIAELSAL